MRVSYASNDKGKSLHVENESHLVLGFGDFDKTKVFLIATDDLRIVNVASALNIVDSDLSEYTQKKEFGKDFFIHNALSECVSDFEHYYQMYTQNLWERSKLAPYFIQSGYELPEEYKSTILNTHYKTGQVRGFLEFASHYINIKNQGDYKENFYFSVWESFEKIVSDPDKIEKIEISGYQSSLKGFIAENLFDKEEGETKSIKMCNSLFRLMDSIFINSIESVYLIDSFYNNMFVVGYEGKFFCLYKSWTS